MAHENSMTEQTADGRFINFVSVVNGVQLTREEAFRRAVRSGRNLGTFDTLKEAVDAARKRSERFDRRNKR